MISRKSNALKIEQIKPRCGPKGSIVLKIIGSAGMEESDLLREKLNELAGLKCPIIVLDIHEMEFICSLGLGAIISTHLKCRHYDGQIRLVGPQPAVLRLLETTRLTRLFTVFSSVDDALTL